MAVLSPRPCGLSLFPSSNGGIKNYVFNYGDPVATHYPPDVRFYPPPAARRVLRDVRIECRCSAFLLSITPMCSAIISNVSIDLSAILPSQDIYPVYASLSRIDLSAILPSQDIYPVYASLSRTGFSPSRLCEMKNLENPR